MTRPFSRTLTPMVLFVHLPHYCHRITYACVCVRIIVAEVIGVDSLAVGGTLALKIGEDFAQMPGKGKRTRGRAESPAFLHVNVDHHERFRMVGSAFTLKVI